MKEYIKDATLKPCPFCLSKNVAITNTNGRAFNPEYDFFFVAGCVDCGAITAMCSDKEQVIKLWNTRGKKCE